MKNILYFFAIFLSVCASHAQDLDTVWTLDISPLGQNSLCCRFMPDGKSFIASVVNNLYEFETATGKKIKKFEPSINSRIVQIEISPNGKSIVGKTEYYEYYSWDFYSGKCNGVINYHDSTKNPASAFSFHAFENKVYFLVNDTIVLYNLNTNQTQRICILPLASYDNLVSSKDGKYLGLSYEYFNSSDQIYHSKLYLFDVIKWEIIKELDDITRDVHAIAFSPKSKYLAFTTLQSEEAFLRLYNLQTGTTQLYPSGYWGFEPWSVLFTQDEKYLLASGGYQSSTKLLNLDSGKTIYWIKHGADQSMIDINSDNQILIDEISYLTLTNSRWFTTSVPPDPRIIINGNMKIKYVNEVLSLDNTDSELIKLICIFDINGKLVKTYDTGYSGATVDLPFAAPAGVYLIRIFTDQCDYNFKFVRE